MREPSHGAMPWRTLKSHQEDIDACPRVANKSVGNIGGTGYYYTNVICVFAMANFVLQLCKTRYLENECSIEWVRSLEYSTCRV